MAFDRSAYDRSTIDWPALTRLAQTAAARTKQPPTSGEVRAVERRQRTVKGLMRSRVVTEDVAVTRRLCPDYWVLESRDWHRRNTDGAQWDESQETYKYCLGADGSLFKRTDSEEEGQWGGPLFHNVEAPTFRPMTDADVCLLDFRPDSYDDSLSGRSSHSWGNRDASAQLLVPTKGAGLTARLNALLPAETPPPPRPATPSRGAGGDRPRPTSSTSSPPPARRPSAAPQFARLLPKAPDGPLAAGRDGNGQVLVQLPLEGGGRLAVRMPVAMAQHMIGLLPTK